MTDNDGVKVLGWKVKRIERPVSELHWQRVMSAESNTPLISALDEADAVDGLCQFVEWCCPKEDKCDWYGHAHADKLRGVKDE